MIIIFIHELGHLLASIFFNWKIEKIIVLPFGCIIRFSDSINKPIIEEFIISIMGIIFQILFSLKINFLYNLIIIIFNLIPIYPLDGSKLLNLCFNKILPFKCSHMITIYLSYFIIIITFIIIIIFRDVLFFFIIVPLFVGIIKEDRNKNYIFNKFLLERYLYQFKFKKSKIINNIQKMKRDYKHILKKEEKYILESDFLRNMFDKKV